MIYSEFIKSINEIEGNNSEFESLVSFFTLNLFDKVALKKFSERYIYFSSSESSNSLLSFLQELEVRKYLYNKYEENIIDKLDKYFSSYFINSKLLKRILDIVLSIESIPSVYDTFLPYINDKYFNISEQIIELCYKLSNDNSESIYVPFKNGLEVSKFTSKKIYGEYVNPNVKLVEFFISIYEKKSLEINITDSLKEPSFNSNNSLKLFDTVIAFPPFSLMGELDRYDKYDRFKIHSGRRLDVACFEHILSQTKKEAIVLMPVGFSFRSGVEEKFRKYLIENNYLKALIHIPSSTHTGTSIETLIYVIDKQKKEESVLFFDLRNKKFLSKSGRQTIFKDIDEIIKLYETKEPTQDINIISNQEIKNNNYNLSIDRYVLSKEAREIKNKLSEYCLIKIENIAEVRKCQTIEEYEDGEEVFELSPTDLDIAGFSEKGNKLKKINIHSKQFDSYSLKPFDILLSIKGVVGKVGIVGENVKYLLASQAIQRIRLTQSKDLKKDAIYLYMYLKSNIGQKLLNELLVQGTIMRQISTTDLKDFQVPILSEEQKDRVVNNFNLEIEKCKQIEKIQEEICLINSSFFN